MAKSRICRSSWNNIPPNGKDKLAGDAPRAPTNGNGTPIPISDVFYTLTPASALGQPSRYTNMNL